jgi:Xaa-Pro aminopeptidase
MFKAVFQSFEDESSKAEGAGRAALLRAEMKRQNLDGFIIPRADEHQNEYVAPNSERLKWLTGFSGSAGMAIVLAARAAIFVDGRYTVQVREQVDVDVFAPQHLIDAPPEDWLSEYVQAGHKIGYDPWLLTPGAVERLSKAVSSRGGELVASVNLVDRVWNRPEARLGKVTLYPDSLAGQTVSAKVARVQSALAGAQCEALVVSDAHNVAWLLNIRGQDVAHTPLPLSFAVVPLKGKVQLYIDSRKLSADVREALRETVEVRSPEDLTAALDSLARSSKKVRLEASTAPAKFKQILGASADSGADPIALMKAAKNSRELSGTRKAHGRDAVALAKFLCWFDHHAPKGKESEISAVKALESFRRETGKLKDVSFPSISGFGPNAAIPHYRVSDASNLKLGRGIFLIDSGAQYLDGTTDITRTLSIGVPNAEMKDRFTRVLKGHIAIARVVFPKGTSGAQIDALARQSLWEAGLDFDHGTGHGVGVYLSVHEGPQRISKLGTVPLQEGMILSNEPGYYKAGAWGIRIENLIVVEKRKIKGAEREMFGFETISFAPIDLRLVEASLLTSAEKDWLNAYHAQVRAVALKVLEPHEQQWLIQATREI